jgi:hypothetical protein
MWRESSRDSKQTNRIRTSQEILWRIRHLWSSLRFVRDAYWTEKFDAVGKQVATVSTLEGSQSVQVQIQIHVRRTPRQSILCMQERQHPVEVVTLDVGQGFSVVRAFTKMSNTPQSGVTTDGRPCGVFLVSTLSVLCAQCFHNLRHWLS